MSTVKVLCADLPGLIKRMVCALCETNITFRHSIEITGSLHIKADETRVLALLLDHVASKPPAAGLDAGEAGAGAAGSGGRLPPSPYSAESPGSASPPAYGAAFVQQHQHSRADDSSPPQQLRSAMHSPQGSQAKQPPAHAYSRGSSHVAGSSSHNSGGSSAPRSDWSHHGVQSHRTVSTGRPDGSKRARLPSADAVVATVTSAHEWRSPGDSAGRTTPSHDAIAATTTTSACAAGPSAASSRHRAGSVEPSATVTCSSASSAPTAPVLAMQPLASSSTGPALPLSQLARRLSENATTVAVQSRVSGGGGSSIGLYGHGQGLQPATSVAREHRRGDSLAGDSGQDGRHHHERGIRNSVAGSSRPPQRQVGLASPLPSASLHQLYGGDCDGAGGGGASGSSGSSAVASSSSSSVIAAAAATRPVAPLGSWVHAYRNAYQKAHRKNGLSCHTCTLCGMHFQRAPSLAAHVNAIHTRERSFKCELCNKVFFRRTAYCNHRRAHHQPGGGGGGGSAAAAALGSAVMALAESMQLGGGDGAGFADGADEGDGGSSSGGMDVSPDVVDSKDGLLGSAAAASAGAGEGRAYGGAAALADTTGGCSRGRGESDRVDSPSEDSVDSDLELERQVATAKQEY